MTAFVWLAKRTLPLRVLDECDPAFALAHRAWWEARREGLLPARAALDRPMLRILLPDAEWLASDARPVLGRLAALGGAVAAQPRAARRRLGDLLLEDQRTVRFTGSALFQEIVVAGPDTVERWRHLLLPTADDGIRVGALFQLLRLVASAPRDAVARAHAAVTPGPARDDGAEANVPDGADGSAAPPASPKTPAR